MEVTDGSYGSKDSSMNDDNFSNDGNNNGSSSIRTPVFPFQQYIPRLFLFDNGPIEATGLAFNSFARGAVAMSTIFLGPALLKLASNAAAKANDCNEDDDDYDADCGEDGGRIYGMRPTSLLTNIGVFSGLLSCALTPIFGSIVDHTPHRKAIGQGSAIILSIVKGIEIFVSESTWFTVSVLQVLNFVIYNAYLCAIYAYTAELSTIPDEQTGYNSRFQGIFYVSMLVFLIVVMVTSTVVGTGDVGTARISQTIASLVCISVFTFSWRFFFRPRPALREVPAGSNFAKSGFQKLSFTFSHIWSYWYTLRYFLLSVMLSEAATAALSTIATTYMTHVLEMGAKEIGQVFLCVFVAGIPGSKLGGMIGVAINPLRSALLCLVIFILNTTLAATVLTGPESQNAMVSLSSCNVHRTNRFHRLMLTVDQYAFAAVWGICLAWLHPTHASIYCTIIPRGQESELMGIYIFSGAVLAWLPPFVFSFLNEIGASMSIGLASLNLFFAGGFVFLLMIGNYNDAVALSQNESMAWTPINRHASSDRVVTINMHPLT